MPAPLSGDGRSRPAEPYGPTITTELMRSINRSAVLGFIRHHSPVSRTEVARKLGVSLPTVMRIVHDLIEEGLVRYDGPGESTGGRPSSLVSFNADANAVLAVDAGGSRFRAVLADVAGNVQREIYLPHAEDADENLDVLNRLIEDLLSVPRPQGQRIRGIGVGVPSVILDPDGVVYWAPSLGWRSLSLGSTLSRRFDLPVFVDNDINLAALGEAEFGAGRRARNLVYISVGTGIGAGIIVGGSIYRGHHQAAGEIGYMLPGVQYLGRRYDHFGALENLASANAIVRRAQELVASADGASGAEASTPQQVFEAAQNGQPWATRVVDEVVDYLSLAIANTSILLDPEVVVLGGRLDLPHNLFIEPIARRLEGIVPFMPRILASSLGDQAAVMGAISFVLEATTREVVVRRFG